MDLAGTINLHGEGKATGKTTRRQDLAKGVSLSRRQSLKLIPSEKILPKLYWKLCFQLGCIAWDPAKTYSPAGVPVTWTCLVVCWRCCACSSGRTNGTWLTGQCVRPGAGGSRPGHADRWAQAKWIPTEHGCGLEPDRNREVRGDLAQVFGPSAALRAEEKSQKQGSGAFLRSERAPSWPLQSFCPKLSLVVRSLKND